MIKTVLKIDGMMCGMCESHINDAIRNSVSVKKVTSSHSKNQTIIISENNLDEQKLRDTIDKTGYKVLSCKSEPYEKKGLFSFKKKS
ncbi:MAG: heavy-metal-associated domain-containing protein [Eubacterium sp.]